MEAKVDMYWIVYADNGRPHLVSQLVSGIWSINLFLNDKDANVYAKYVNGIKKQMSITDITKELSNMLDGKIVKVILQNVTTAITKVNKNFIQMKNKE
jgi:hypothetical protein